MRFLVATDSVHVTAAACDYLEERLAPDDTVVVVTVTEGNSRDAADALNVANVRLVGQATVETEQLDAEDTPANSILAAAERRASDVIVLGARRGRADAGVPIGTTIETVLAESDVPIVAVPVSV